MNKSICFFFIALLSLNVNANNADAPEATINWLTVEEVGAKMEEEPRKLFFDVYTSWCGWCKKMDQSTFKNSAIVEKLNTEYYAVKFDAEQKTDIKFGGKTYKFVDNGRKGYNELAQFLLGGQLSYPSFAVFDKTGKKLSVLQGFQPVNELTVILEYFTGNYHTKIAWEEFKKRKATGQSVDEPSRTNSTSKTTVKKEITAPKLNPNRTDAINWITIEEVQVLMKEETKKVFVDIYADWCGWCKRMDQTTFIDPAVIKYMNQNYYCVKLDAEQKTDIEFGGKTYKFVAEGKRGYNQLPALLLDGKMSLPSFVVFGDDGKRASILPGYRKAPEFIQLMRFYKNDDYKKMTFVEYQAKNKPNTTTNE